MTTRSWIRRLFARKPRTLRKAPARRPALEVLEDRSLLSLTPTSLALSVSSPALVYGQSETLTAVVTTPNGDPTPTASDGTVSFYAGATLLGSATLSGSTAKATLTTTALPGGTDKVTARYSGDNSFAASTTTVSPASTVSFVQGGIYSDGVAVDGAGNVFVADFVYNQVYEINPGAAPITNASGLNGPKGVAVDAAGDLFIADTGNNQVLEVRPGAAPTTFVSGLNGPQGLAVDSGGNVYIADTGNNRVLKVTADGSQQTTVGANLNGPSDVAVDAQGDVFIADAGNQQVVEVPAAGGSQTTVINGVPGLSAVAADAQGDLFLTSDLGQSQTADGPSKTVLELTAASNWNLLDGNLFGQDTFQQPSGLAVDSQGDVFVTDPGFLIDPLNVGVVQEITAGVPVTVSPAATTLALSAASSTLYNGQSATFTATLTSPTGAVPRPGDGSVTFYNGAAVLGSAPWSARGTAVLTTASLPVGTSLSVTASYSGDNNFQGSHFGIRAANPQRVVPATGLSQPEGVAVDSAGDVFIADFGSSGAGDVQEVKADGSQSTVGSGLGHAWGVAVDGSGDVFIVDSFYNQVVEVKPDHSQSTFASGLAHPQGVAVDGQGDVFIANTNANQVLEVKPDHTTSTWGSGLIRPQGVAVDRQGDVFIADTGNDRVVEVTPSGTQTTLGPVIAGPSWLKAPTGVAVDGAGDVFIADQGNNRVVELGPDGIHTTSVGSGLSFAHGVAVDGAGDVFIADTGNGRVVEVMPHVSVTVVGPTPTAFTLSVASQALDYGQSDTITATITVPQGAVLPGSGDGTVTFYDNGAMLGSPQTLSDGSATAALTTAPLALGEHNFTATYSGDSSFLPSSSGVGPQSALSTIQSYPAQPGLTTYVNWFAQDGNGNFFFDVWRFVNRISIGQVIEERKADGTYTTLYTAGEFEEIGGLAVDSAGNLLIAHQTDVRVPPGEVSELTPSGTLTTLVSGPFIPWGLAVDTAGDLIFGDYGRGRVLKLTPSGTLSTIASGFIWNAQIPGDPVAMDGQGDVFINDALHSRAVEVKPDGTQTTLGTGLSIPYGVAVDTQGDVFIYDAGNNAYQRVVEVKPDGTQTTLGGDFPFESGLIRLDGQGDMFTAYDFYDPNNVNNVGLLKVTPGVPVSVTVPTAISVSASSTAPLYGQSVTFTATVTVPSGDPVPTAADGTVTFYDGDTVLGTATLSGASGTTTLTTTATLTTAALAPGVHMIGASYTGDEDYAAASTQTTVGSGLTNPRGLAVDGQGDVFIAELANDRVVEVKPDGTQTTVASGSIYPIGVAVDGQGDVFIANGFNQRLLEVKPDGTRTTVRSGLNLIESVAVDGQGDVFIAEGDGSSDGELLEVKPDGTQTTVCSGLDTPRGVAVDAQGDVFIAEKGNSSVGYVLEVKPDGTQTTVCSGLTYPYGVAVDAQGDLFVTNADLVAGFDRVLEVKPDGTQTTLGFGIVAAFGVAVDGQGDVFVADFYTNRVLELTPLAVDVRVPTSIAVSASNATPVYGQSVTLTATVTVPSGDPKPTSTHGTVTFYDNTSFLATVPLSGSTGTATLTTVSLAVGTNLITASYSGDSSYEPSSMQSVVPVPGLSSPDGVAVDSAGDLFIADTNNNRVVELKADGSQTIVGSGLSAPTAVAVDGQGDVFIADAGNQRVVEVAAGGGQTTVASGLSTPWGVAVDSAGDIFIAEPNSNQVVEVTPPSPTQPSGSQTTVGTGLNAPYGVGVDSAGDVFIADTDNNRVVEVKGGSQTTVGSGLFDPTGVAVDSSGDVFIADWGNSRVVEVQPHGTQATVATGFNAPFGISVDSSGDVFIADAGNNQVVEAKPAASVTVSPANAHPSVTPYSVTFDGNSHTASGNATDVNGNALPAGDFTLTATMHTAAGTYGTDTWSFHDSSGNYLDASGTVSDSISPANAHPSVAGYSIPYNGNAHTAVGSATGVNGNPLPASDFVLTATVHTNPGTYTDAWTFHDPSGNYQDASGSVSDSISAPLASITGPTIGVPGQPLTYSFAVTYGPNGPTQGITFSINYGDGTSLTTSVGGPSIKLDHLYTATGTFTIQVTAKDPNGVVSQLATQAVKISTVAMESDPSGGTALAVGGKAAGGDTILVSAANTSGTAVSVSFDKAAPGTFTPTGHIFVYGQDGKDTIKLNPYVVGNTSYYIRVPAFLYGEGSGGDKISAAGSAANNVLSGHGSNEVLTGGQGRDLLIGGTGAATLNAGVGDDLLIGGWTNYDIGSAGMTYDQKLAALEAIMAEWGSSDAYATRLSKLGGYLNTTTVHDNYHNGVAVVDQLLGNAKANDWFFAGVNDSVTGKNSNDLITTIK
jgi:sugar lactone lactonase YvrE